MIAPPTAAPPIFAALSPCRAIALADDRFRLDRHARAVGEDEGVEADAEAGAAP